jgi:hypothetical protein
MTMTMPLGRVLVIAVIWAALLPATDAAGHACEDVTISGTPRLTILDAYSPFSPADLTGVTTVTIANTGDETCPLAAVFTAENGGRLRNAGETLGYGLETLDGAALLNPPSLTDPEAGQHFPVTLAGGQAASMSVRARVPPQQISPPGTYEDRTALLRLYHMPSHGFPSLLSETPFPVAAEVAAVCRIAPPQPATLDFTEDIGTDASPKGEWRGVQFPETACNTSARLQLEGRALAREGGTAPTGFDAFIDIEAFASFQSVTATLLTDGADEPITAQSLPTAQDGTAAPLDLQVRLRRGKPLAAGTYQSVLTITLEPSS